MKMALKTGITSIKYCEHNENKGNEIGTSIFDPVLCEIMYKWFCPPGGRILDPFCGGSVRGIVAGYLGYKYRGVDLSKEQVKANYSQIKIVKGKEQPEWINGDSNDIDKLADGNYDFVFSCPPYYDLEVYGDDPKDLSNMSYEDFIKSYSKIILKSIKMLKNNRFAVFVVGDIRDKGGIYRNFVSETIKAFQDAGAKLYNEAIFITATGSLPIRVARAFVAGRKLGKTHQNVLVFVKGDPKIATKDCGKIEIADITDEQ